MEVASHDDPNFALRRMEMEVAVQVCVCVGGCGCGWVCYVWVCGCGWVCSLTKYLKVVSKSLR